MDVKELVEHCFKDLIYSFQIARLYDASHRKFSEAIDKTYAIFQDFFKENRELIFGIVGEELAFEKEIFFELSKILKTTLLYLKQRGIEKITFYSALTKEELSKFVIFLATAKEKMDKEPEEYLHEMHVQNILVGKIRAPSLSAEEASGDIIDLDTKRKNLLKIYDSSLERSSESIEAVMDTRTLDALNLRFSLDNILENLISHYNELLKLTTIKRFDLSTFVHMINVSILSMYFSFKIGFNKNDVLDIGTAALFHDIGKLYISRRIIKKPEKLTDEEVAKIKSHPVLGAEILLGYVDILGVLPAVVTYEHHTKYNLKGYPKLIFSRKTHIASLIVSICDVYDALFQRRSYKRDYPPNFVYELMVKEKGETFAPELLDKFFQIMGVWPIGTIVSLSDGSVAEVIEENEDNIYSPRVELLTPNKERKELVDLKEKKELKIIKSLNPLTEGKEYL